RGLDRKTDPALAAGEVEGELIEGPGVVRPPHGMAGAGGAQLDEEGDPAVGPQDLLADGSTRDFEGARGVAIELDADRPEALGAAEEDLGRPFALDPGVPVRLARGTAQELEPEPVR